VEGSESSVLHGHLDRSDGIRWIGGGDPGIQWSGQWPGYTIVVRIRVYALSGPGAPTSSTSSFHSLLLLVHDSPPEWLMQDEIPVRADVFQSPSSLPSLPFSSHSPHPCLDNVVNSAMLHGNSTEWACGMGGGHRGRVGPPCRALPLDRLAVQSPAGARVSRAP